MKHISKMAALSLALLVSACGPAGYYDSAGRWHPYENNASQPTPGGTPGVQTSYVTTEGDGQYTVAPPSGTTTVIQYQNPPTTTEYVATPAVGYTFTRAGFYDHNGYYLNAGPQISSDYWPPSGMCRVWFTDRNVDAQPPVESCNGIQARVPVDAYILFGGL